jgi:hypothetical protein
LIAFSEAKLLGGSLRFEGLEAEHHDGDLPPFVRSVTESSMKKREAQRNKHSAQSIIDYCIIYYMVGYKNQCI